MRVVRLAFLWGGMTLLMAAAVPAVDGEWATETISRRQMQSIVEFLSLDHLAGRAPGTAGAEIAERYIVSLMKLWDIEPYGEDYFQEFSLTGLTVSAMDIRLGGHALSFPDEAAGGFAETQQAVSVTAPLVFAGYGIVADDWQWNDYPPDSVRGKIVLVRVNDPHPEDPDKFEGPAMTYYGRWTYKIEEAARQGAAGILLIHTTESAGYGWHVVRNSWTGERLYLSQTLPSTLRFRGWIREEILRQRLAAAGVALDDLYRRSVTPGFAPVDLPITLTVSGEHSAREFQTRNVVGFIPAAHTADRNEAIALSAHIDHLGVNPTLTGDQIFNGAVDNAAAVAAMMLSAKILKANQSSLRYPVIVLACEAEEAGLLGSQHFVESLAPGAVKTNINFESTPVGETARDIFAVGAGYSSLEECLQPVLQARALAYSRFSMVQHGWFYRSDQFSFARKGIPAIWLSAGEDYPSGKNWLRDFFEGDYHTPDDEFDPAWDMGATIQTVHITIALIEYLNRVQPTLHWKARLPFPRE